MEDTIMKKVYINPEITVVKMKMNSAILVDSLTKGSDGVSDENNVLSRDWDDWED